MHCCEFPQTKIRDEKVFGYQPQGEEEEGGIITLPFGSDCYIAAIQRQP